MIKTSFLKLMGGGMVVEPFSRMLLGGKARTKKNTLRGTKKKAKTIKFKKNLSRKKATRRIERSHKRSINKRTKAKRGKTKSKTYSKTQTNQKKKRQCNCDTDRFYQGNEPSPKGLGFCAHCIPENVTMKGFDGNLWENQKYKKGKRWVKIRVDMN